MKILITGMNGFLGAAITKKLFHTDHQLIGLVRSKTNLPDEVLEKYKVIVSDISKKVPKIDCDLVIHCAATVNDRVLAVIMNKTNVEGTRRVLEATGNAPFIYISSGDVYNLTEKPHVEDEGIYPKLLTSYARSKYLSEQIIRTEFPDRDTLILRSSALYGKGDRILLARLLKLYKDGTFTVPGNLDQETSMTNIEFFTEVIESFINRGISGQEIYNVADFHDYNLGENLTTLFSTLFQRDVQVNTRNEIMVRIWAGMRDILVPGNYYTQAAIDFMTRDHVLKTDKLRKTFPQLTGTNFKDYIPSYVQWINNVGVNTIAKQTDPRIVWL